jgi:hypothetical protein
MNTMTVRFLGAAAVCLSLVACGGVDAQKFDAVYKAGKALQSEVQSSGNSPRLDARDRLKEFETAVNALQDHTIGIKEADALHAYDEAADGYRQFLRFRAMETEPGTNQIVLKGPILEVATRYKLPVDTRSGSKYVNRAQAVTILLQAAEQHLADGNRFIGRQ